jgi:hypothetical protein
MTIGTCANWMILDRRDAAVRDLGFETLNFVGEVELGAWRIDSLVLRA